MTSDEVRGLRRERARLVEEMHDLTEKSSWGDEAQKRWKQLDREQKDLQGQIARAETDLARDEMSRVNVPPQPEIRLTPQLSAHEQALSSAMRPFQRDLESNEYRSAFDSWLRRGTDGLAQSERTLLTDLAHEVRTYSPMNTGSGPSGDYLVPIGFQRELEQRMKAYGGMRRNCRIVPTSTGQPMYWPAVDDTANMGRWLAETGAVSQTNPTFGNIEFQAYLASSDQVLVSVQLLQDSAFDLEALLTQLLGIRLGRLTDIGYTTGAGTTQPTGIITAILADSNPNTVTAVGSSANDGVSTNTGANSIGTDDLAALVDSVDPLYRPNAKFLAHWSILDYLKKVKDKYGRPLFVVGTEVGQPDTIFGYKYDWSGSMDAAVNGVPAASKNTVLFGDFDKYIIRDVLGMTMVRITSVGAHSAAMWN
jgi:HK97 family phage major capsid protein